MEISASAIGVDQTDEIRQALLLKRAIKAEQAQQLALLESASLTAPGQTPDTRLVGRLLNEKA